MLVVVDRDCIYQEGIRYCQSNKFPPYVDWAIYIFFGLSILVCIAILVWVVWEYFHG